MMLIFCDKNPFVAANYLIEHTNKNFVFKQLLELGQLVCSCGYSKVYKSVRQGKAIQEWIKKNKLWVYRFYSVLWFWCMGNTKMTSKTACDLYSIRGDLYSFMKSNRKRIIYPKIAIFRYKQGYECEYESNSELPIDIAIEQYRKYIDWKFKKDEVQ